MVVWAWGSTLVVYPTLGTPRCTTTAPGTVIRVLRVTGEEALGSGNGGSLRQERNNLLEKIIPCATPVTALRISDVTRVRI